jgi:hypothetical protein
MRIAAWRNHAINVANRRPLLCGDLAVALAMPRCRRGGRSLVDSAPALPIWSRGRSARATSRCGASSVMRSEAASEQRRQRQAPGPGFLGDDDLLAELDAWDAFDALHTEGPPETELGPGGQPPTPIPAPPPRGGTPSRPPPPPPGGACRTPTSVSVRRRSRRFRRRRGSN